MTSEDTASASSEAMASDPQLHQLNEASSQLLLEKPVLVSYFKNNILLFKNNNNTKAHTRGKSLFELLLEKLVLVKGQDIVTSDYFASLI